MLKPDNLNKPPRNFVVCARHFRTISIFVPPVSYLDGGLLLSTWTVELPSTVVFMILACDPWWAQICEANDIIITRNCTYFLPPHFTTQDRLCSCWHIMLAVYAFIKHSRKSTPHIRKQIRNQKFTMYLRVVVDDFRLLYVCIVFVNIKCANSVSIILHHVPSECFGKICHAQHKEYLNRVTY